MADEKQEKTLNLAQKLARVMGMVSRVPKNGRNTFHNYDYATEGDVADCVREALAEGGVAVIPSTEKVEWREAGPAQAWSHSRRPPRPRREVTTGGRRPRETARLCACDGPRARD